MVYDKVKMVQGQKSPPGEMFQVKSDYPACFSLLLRVGVLVAMAAGVAMTERLHGSNMEVEKACEDE